MANRNLALILLNVFDKGSDPLTLKSNLPPFNGTTIFFYSGKLPA